MSVANIMSVNVVTVEMDDSLALVKEIFHNTRFHHLLVVEHGCLCGVISDRDLLKSVSPKVDTVAATERDLASLNKKVHQVMSRKLVTLTADASFYDAVDVFVHKDISCIPIVDNKNKN